MRNRPRTDGRCRTDAAPLLGGLGQGVGQAGLCVERADSVAELPWRGDRDEAGGEMIEASERRAGTTRHRLIAAASRLFARRPYSLVSLDDILAEAELTKGAMYFHFSSKQALAVAIIDDLTEMSRCAVTELVARKMSGLETVIDLVYLLAVQETQSEVARAGVRLLDTVDERRPGHHTVASMDRNHHQPDPKSSHRGRRRRPP